LNYGGHIYSTAFNVLGTADTATTATHYFVETGSDGFIRPKTLANARTELVTTASVNSAAATTVGTITSGVWNAGAVTSSGAVSAGTQVLAPSGALVGAPGFSWTGNTGTGIYRPATDTIAIVTNSNERMRVLANGNVGIGITDPTYKLQVNGTFSSGNIYSNSGLAPAGGFSTVNSGDSKFLFYDFGGTNWCGTGVDTNGNWWLRTGVNGQNLIIARENGNVGIGTTNPLAKLHVNGNFYCPGSVVQCITTLYTDMTTYSAPSTITPTEITVLNVTITPKRANSKIVLQWMINGELHHDSVILVYRDETPIGYNTTSGFNVQWSGVIAAPYEGDQDSTPLNMIVNWIDLPNTTAAIKYSVRVRASGAAARTFYLGRSQGNTGSADRETTCSTGVAWEICV
jgi:hypothetical protein